MLVYKIELPLDSCLQTTTDVIELAGRGCVCVHTKASKRGRYERRREREGRGRERSSSWLDHKTQNLSRSC